MIGTTTVIPSGTTTLSGIFVTYTGINGEGGAVTVVTDPGNAANFSSLSALSPSTSTVAHGASDSFAYSGDVLGSLTPMSSAGESWEGTGYGPDNSEYSAFSLNTTFFATSETFNFYMETYDTATTVTLSSTDLGSNYASYNDTLGGQQTLVEDYITLNLTGLTVGDNATFAFATGYNSSGNYPTQGIYGATVTAAPEPSTYAMILGGVGLLTLSRRRRHA